MTDWNPQKYAQFGGLRLRPALDLLAQVYDLPTGDVIDLGCGNGPVGGALKARFGDRRLIGLDSSPAMLEIARGTGAYDELVLGDATAWEAGQPVSLIYSNALCHWLPDHKVLFSRLAKMLTPRGVLAVQMPRQFQEPSHILLRDIATEMFADRFDFSDWKAPVSPPETYAQMSAGLGQVNAWETVYIQRLDAVDTGHPVKHFTQSTAMRPFVERLDETQQREFVTEYETRLDAAYPKQTDGSVLFPFRRVFFTLRVAS